MEKDKGLHLKVLPQVNFANIMLVCYDACTAFVAYFLALWIRFDCRFSAVPNTYLEAFLRFAPFYVVICIVVFKVLRLYQSIWRYASFVELERVILATMITAFLHGVGITIMVNASDIPIGRMPVSYHLVGCVFQFSFLLAIRFSYRFVLLLRQKRSMESYESADNVMLIGAGDAGRTILRDIMQSRRTHDRVCCIIDDDREKWNRSIEGVPVVGGRDDILINCEKYNIQKIYFAIPAADAQTKREILNICNETGCELRSLPGLYQLVNGDITVNELKQVAIEDLLGREPIRVDLSEILETLEGKNILVTGGGGSIGSELCRQIATHNPHKLIIFDIYENNAYDIEQELKNDYPNLNLEVIIGSVRDEKRVEQLFMKYKPDIVYHAAAHKHVPLMEMSPCETIKNNVCGTLNVARAAGRYGAKRFVLISTDKAVNPTNIMGASKRICEMIVQDMSKKVAGTEYVAVRFGNVLGSNGSVIPLFKKQISAGGPVTVTHPDIIRYFMTISEAVSLVLQAGVYAKGGEIFVLDMGSPMKIDTLARNLIKLSGLKPDEDIKIKYVGLRAGEKMYEEKLMDEEGLKETPNRLIHIGSPIDFDHGVFEEKLERLIEAADDNSDEIRSFVKEIVKTYTG